MLKKALVIIGVIMIGVSCVGGCKKRASEADYSQEVVKTKAEYEADAKEQIDKENMAKELDEIEKTLTQELSQK